MADLFSMGIFGRILGYFCPCFGLSPRHRNRYHHHGIQTKSRQPYNYYQDTGHSSNSKQFSFSTETSSAFHRPQAVVQPTQSTVRSNDRISHNRPILSSTRSGKSKIRTPTEAPKPPSGSGHRTNTARVPDNQGNTRPLHTKQQQACHVKPPQSQPKSSQTEPKRSTQTSKTYYHLKKFTFQLETTPKDKTFIPKGDIIYQNQWIACNAVITNQFSNTLPKPAVSLSSNSQVQFRNTVIDSGRLRFSMKCTKTGTISIFIKVDQCKFLKEFCVICSPCSSTLSEMVIKEVDSHECVYQLAIVDVFGKPVLSDSLAVCELKNASSEIVQKTQYTESGKKYINITSRREKPWSKETFLLLNGKPISPAKNFEVAGEERKKITLFLQKKDTYLSLFEEKDQIPCIDDFVSHQNSRMFIPLLTGDDDGKFIDYNENNCQIQFSSNCNGYQLICRNANKYDILGADFAHINNIKRVLQLNDRVDIEDSTDQSYVIIDLKNVQPYLHKVCKNVVQHLLRGLYYRRKASEAAKIRMEWKKRNESLHHVLKPSSSDAYHSLKLCKMFKNVFGELMNKYNSKACNELFEFFNFYRDDNEVDLHGLLVADESRLELLRMEMLRGSLGDEEMEIIFQQCKIQSFKGRKKEALKRKLLKGEIPKDEIGDFLEVCRRYMCDSRLETFERELLQRQKNSKHVDEIICTYRSESDEAIRKLKTKLDTFDIKQAATMDNNTSWLEIIVGAGRHGKVKNEQNIRPKVEKLLKERKLTFAPVNKGSLVVTFKAYTGPEPCFGEYYCNNCDRCWKSSKSYVDKYQKCSRCQVDCWPVKQREKEKIESYHRDGSVKRKPGRHESSLCQKCKELGYNCNRDDYQ